MPCGKCHRQDAPRVTLIDGREVCSYCEDWRHECEARAILSMPTLRQRRDFLYGKLNKWGDRSGGVRQKRGEAEVKRLEATMTALWNARK